MEYLTPSSKMKIPYILKYLINTFYKQYKRFVSPCIVIFPQPIFYKGVAGSQVTLSSLVNQSRAMLEEQARHLLTEAERHTMSYYLDQYRDGHVGVEQLVIALFELFNTHAKVKTHKAFRKINNHRF